MTQYINGAWQDGTGDELVSWDPATGEKIWSGQMAKSGEVDAAVSAAREAFAVWGLTSLDERLAVIKRYAGLATERKAELAKLIAREAGKTLWDATGEATATANKINISIQAYTERTGEREALNGAIKARLGHRPHGVMAVFGPYNFPAHLPNGHIVPALIAGNTIVFKPSEQTPAVAEYVARLWHEAGLPAGVLNLVQGSRETGEALVANDDIDGVLFTGSANTGLAISRALLERPQVIQALELGGNNPLIVHEAKDHQAAAVLTVLSAFVSSGQRCTCARRLIVPEGGDGDAFIECLLGVVDKITVGSMADAHESFMGPVISSAAASAVLSAQEALLEAGAVALRPVTQLDLGDAFLSPGVLDVTSVTDRPDEEVFGPLLQVIRVADFDAAIAEANNTKYGLAAGLLSDSKELYEYFYPRSRAGIVNWNQQLTGAASTAPFGGIGWSGNHRPSAYYAADYCAYPVASMEQAEGRVAVATMPVGIDLSSGEA